MAGMMNFLLIFGRFFLTGGRFGLITYPMKNTVSFFAPSITLENGASILTGENKMLVSSVENEGFTYRVGGEFADVAPDFLDYEKLVAILSEDGWNEFDIADLMEESLENEKEHYGI